MSTTNSLNLNNQSDTQPCSSNFLTNIPTMQQYLKNFFKGQFQTDLERSGSRSSSNIAYMLFMYREELGRLKKNAIELSKNKLHLTQKMLSYSMGCITKYNMQELMNINQEMSFTRQLKCEIDDMDEMLKLCELEAQFDLIGF